MIQFAEGLGVTVQRTIRLSFIIAALCCAAAFGQNTSSDRRDKTDTRERKHDTEKQADKRRRSSDKDKEHNEALYNDDRLKTRDTGDRPCPPDCPHP
jgi:hypothetical protein